MIHQLNLPYQTKRTLSKIKHKKTPKNQIIIYNLLNHLQIPKWAHRTSPLFLIIIAQVSNKIKLEVLKTYLLISIKTIFRFKEKIEKSSPIKIQTQIQTKISKVSSTFIFIQKIFPTHKTTTASYRRLCQHSFG